MKLISFCTLLFYSTVIVGSQKYQEENYSFPPLYQTPSSILFSSDSSVYLPPESQTPVPYNSFNKVNKLSFHLPPTGTKAPSIYPTSFPIFLSSTYKSNYEDEDNDDEHNDYHRSLINIKRTPITNMNSTVPMRRVFDKKEFQNNLRTPSFSNSENTHENKSPNIISSTSAPMQNYIKPAARRMVVTSEFQRVDSGMDQVKSASVQNSQYIQAPGNYISSTEPAIPILRLSNEMDLDGSFSYEALGADQTHYVQHSRMENMGTDKEQQVVEGSYSYVGDDGRTYTVHYVADSNGFRASGDHLPVAPPIPEIIQRSVQYNLAEEAKRPPHLKSSWDNDDRDFEVVEETRRNIYHVPPPRNLFTGRTPEAFSMGFSQGQMLNTVKVSNPPPQNKTNMEINTYKSKFNNVAPSISPQITFLASQGTHNPTIQSQSHVTKVNSMEKSSLPKIMNYEAEIKDSEQEASKALWRWQYGLNAGSNENTNKNSISRSSSDSDDVYINFSDMTPNQYKQIMQSQILGKNSVESNTIERSTEVQFSSPRYNDNLNSNDANVMNSEHLKNMMTETYQPYTSTERNDIYFYEAQKIKTNPNLYSEIISSYNFTPQSQIATKSYNIEITSIEPVQSNVINKMASNYTTLYNNNNNYYPYTNNYMNENNSSLEFEKTITSSLEETRDYVNNDKHIDVELDEKNTFKPLLYKTEMNFQKYETTTTEAPIENVIKDNIFLRNLFKVPEKEDTKQKNVIESNDQNQNKSPEPKSDKVPKFIQYEQLPQNEIKYFTSKPMDLSEVLNYVVMKNSFESSKTKPRNKAASYNQNYSKDGSFVHYIPIKENNEKNENNKQAADYRVLNNEQQKELQGLIKNYKVLQRRKNIEQKSQFLPEPQRHIKAFHTQNLPPLGRAGPSMKSYLPPTYL